MTSDEIARVLAPIEQSRPLPARVYYHPDVFAFERRAIFDRAWTMVGREEDVEHPGAWILAPVAGENLVIARSPDLTLRAFHNVCRHRASPLVTGSSGRAQHFECPYH